MKTHIQIRINEQILFRSLNYFISVNLQNCIFYSNGLLDLDVQGSFFLGRKVSVFGYTPYRSVIQCMSSLLQLQVTFKKKLSRLKKKKFSKNIRIAK